MQCVGDLNGDDWLSPLDVSALVSIILPHKDDFYWVDASGAEHGDITGDGWISPTDISALVSALLPHQSSNYWLICDASDYYSGHNKYEYLDTSGNTDTYRVTREYRNAEGLVTRRKTYKELNENPMIPSGDYYIETMSYTYDDKKLQTKVVIPPLGSSNKRRKEYTYDTSIGWVETEKWYDDNNSATTVSAYDYENLSTNTFAARVLYYADARGDVEEPDESTAYTYAGDDDLLPETKTMPKVSTGIPLGGAMQLKYEYEYDSRNRLKKEEVYDYDWGTPANSTLIAQTEYVYDDENDTLTIHRCTDDSDCDTYKETTTYTYNKFGQKIKMQLHSGVIWGWTYYANGRLDSEILYYQYSTTAYSQTKYLYDDDGRVEYVQRALDSGTFTVDSPNDWIITKYEYDDYGRRTKVIEDDGGANLTTQYEYKTQNEVTKVTLPNGKWTETYRDGRGLVERTEVGPNGTGQPLVTEFRYDGNGNLVEQIDPDSIRTKYDYDDFDRVEKVTRGLGWMP